MAKTKYEEDFPARVEEYASKGLTNHDISKNLGISQETFYQYVNNYPEFSESLKRGKAITDQIVESALYKNAIGYEFEEVVTVIKIGIDGQPTPSEIKKTKKHIQGDTTAQIFWLKNRLSENWRDKKGIDHSGVINIPIIKVLDGETEAAVKSLFNNE